MKKLNISVDMDDVLCNTIPPWKEWIKKKYSVSSDVNYWGDPVRNIGKSSLEFYKPGSNVYDISEPFDGAIDFMKLLCNNSSYNVKIVTFAFPGMRDAKLKWFKNHIPFITSQEIITVEGDKDEFTEGGILIDDGFHNIIRHVSHNNDHGILLNTDNYPHVEMFKPCCDGNLCHYASTYSDVLYKIKAIERIKCGI